MRAWEAWSLLAALLTIVLVGWAGTQAMSDAPPLRCELLGCRSAGFDVPR